MNLPESDPKDIFAEALRLTDPAQRAAYLDGACAGKPAVRQEVERRLGVLRRRRRRLGPPPLGGEVAGQQADAVLGPQRGEERLPGDGHPHQIEERVTDEFSLDPEGGARERRGDDHRCISEASRAFYRIHGIRIRRVLTDNAKNYTSHLFRGLCLARTIEHWRTKPYRPCTNGKAERFIQTLLREWAYKRPYTSSRRRTAALPPWLHRYNHRRPHGSLGGESPITRVVARQ